jgi:hypothetical protein
MSHAIARCLILLVLFTHSTMAIDVHLPGSPDQDTVISGSLDSTSLVSSDIDHCADTNGHCSHHQAHTAGLFSAHDLLFSDMRSVLFSPFKALAFIYNYAPPVRPPKS